MFATEMKVMVAGVGALEMDSNEGGNGTDCRVGDGCTTTGRVDERVHGKAGGGDASNGNDGGGACFWKKGWEGA